MTNPLNTAYLEIGSRQNENAMLHDKHGNQIKCEYIAYLRVSTDEQDIENQKAKVESLIRNKGLNPECVRKGGDVLWVMDEGVSATKFPEFIDRENGKSVWNWIRKGEVKMVFSFSVDRMFRRQGQGHYFADECRKYETQIITGETPNGIEDEVGYMSWSFVLMRSEMEILTLKKRTKAGMDSRRKQHKPTTSATWGWDIQTAIDEDGNIQLDRDEKPIKRVVPNWQEVSIIDWINDRVSEGWSFNKCASKLNSIDLRGKTGGKWRSSSISKMLKAKQHEELINFERPSRMASWPFTSLRKKQVIEFD